ncbi:dnaJ homolog subfamily C member 16-like [Oppia nitens]|uniref:dnaJ homolog subfamily C member 16-like n=1 Tax=Oppia nitens TaxID=1686743 RepID=UPI0023DA3E5A|nr:dnaJ homolog subfamily C member 16-like [Oppia nitens]
MHLTGLWLPLTAVLIGCLVAAAVVDAYDPYDVLGVKRSASVSEIKRSYKSLVRVLHPDKSTDADAETKFIELNKAYELLMDPERRRQFDRTGATEDAPNFRHEPDYSGFKRFDFDPFDTFTFTTSSGQYHFNFNGANVFRKMTITTRAYENNILMSSHSRPFLILFYGDLCFACLKMEHLWQKMVTDLEPLGVGFATIHSQHESKLARKLGVETLPYIISVVEGEKRVYRESEISLAKIVEFIRNSLPQQLVEEVDDNNYLKFLNGWHDNRVRTLFITEESNIKLRYQLVAFEFRDRIAFAHVTSGQQSMQILTRYRVDHKMNSMLIFNEDITRTTATLSLSELKPQLMRDVLESNKFLLLPRLASQSMFDQLCPAESVRSRRRLCIVLVTNNMPEHEAKREAMRQFMRENNYPKERFRFMYLFEEKQPEFVKALTIGSNTPQITSLQVVVLWRRQMDHVFFEWLPNGWDFSDERNENETKVRLNNLLNKLTKNTEDFTNNAKVMALIDESARGLFGRIVKKILIITDNISDNITRREVLPAISIVLSVCFIVFIGYIMAYLVRIEEETIKEKYKRLGKPMPGVSQPKNDCKLLIHELRGETYNGLIRLLKPGCRTLVLLVDETSKPKLLAQFKKAVYPYRKNKTLMFAFLMVDKNRDWYANLLMQALGKHRALQINPKNCIGTIVSINGFRKYFCVYHAKHPERRKPHESTSGAFIGFSDDSSGTDTDVEAGDTKLIDRQTGDMDDEIVFEEHLLDGLSNWLDRLFEGSTQRYHIQYWPEKMKY